MARQRSALVAQPAFEVGDERNHLDLALSAAMIGIDADKVALDTEYGIDAADRFGRDRRDDGLLAPLELSGDVGELEELAARMSPA